MAVVIRPAVEADEATIEAMAHVARLIPRGLYRPRFLVAACRRHWFVIL